MTESHFKNLARAAEVWNETLSIAEVAKASGWTELSVLPHLSEARTAGINVRYRKPDFSWRDAAAIKAWEAYGNNRDVAAAIGVGQRKASSILSILRRRGLIKGTSEGAIKAKRISQIAEAWKEFGTLSGVAERMGVCIQAAGRMVREARDAGEIEAKMPSLQDSFYEHITEGEGGCWLWQRAITKHSGYGKLWFRGKIVAAHRVSWVLVNGDIEDNLQVLHRCDVRLCVNPSHLFLGTQADNMADMAMKLRAGRKKLTPDIVRYIRASRASRSETIQCLADKFGVSLRAIKMAANGTSWGHVK